MTIHKTYLSRRYSAKWNAAFVMLFCFFFLSFMVTGFRSVGQGVRINPQLLSGSWNANWISAPDVSARSYGVFHFRKAVDLEDVPQTFVIHVSADNRYRLFVNGVAVGRGPARGDLYNWNFETYDIAPQLHQGKNVIAAQVWNMAELAPVAQISNRTGFLLQGDTKNEQIINTNRSWKVFHDEAYSPVALNMGAVLRSYFVVGPGDAVQGKDYPWNWEKTDYDDSGWKQAKPVSTPVVPVGYGTDNLWTLTPRSIPQMEETPQRFGIIRREEGIKTDASFLDGNHPLTIPAHTHATILIDQSFETVGYPELITDGGEGSSIKLTYAEALFDKNNKKGNRNDINGKTIRGLYDIFYPDGGQNRSFSTLWVRAYRYVQMDIQTNEEPLVIRDFYGIYSTYPFKRTATFSSSDASLADIWNVGWRTARLCAGETYFDCPYYEQLQYEGDTRIQALISLYNTGDDRLMRKAIHDFYLSRVPEGLTQGRFPSNRLQVIPPYSLFWVSMLYDYWMLRPDTAFVSGYLDAAAGVLKWYEQCIDKNMGMLGPMKWWNFTDWDLAFPNGVPDGATDGNSSVVTLQYVYTLQQAEKLMSYFGRKDVAAHYAAVARELAQKTYQHCFDTKKMEMANTPEKTSYSQHAGIMAILTGTIPEKDEKQVMNRVLYDTTLSQATFYYRFYLTRAMIKAGMADLYYAQLTPWRDMLKTGLTTFAENPDPTRSDCHAWSASPVYDFLSTICGIMPDAPGFSKVRIAPAFGDLTKISGSMPLYDGSVSVELQRNTKNKGVSGTISLPENISGHFVWNGKEIPLHGGKQTIRLQ